MKPAPNYYLFVYGSLMSGFKSPAYDYITRYFDLVSTGRVQGGLYDMGDYPAAVPSEHPQDQIHGELYRIRNEKEFSWAIGQLDDYEGVKGEAGEKLLYRRSLAEVQADPHSNEEHIEAVAPESVAAWIYWYDQDVTGRPRIASGDILQYIESKK